MKLKLFFVFVVIAALIVVGNLGQPSTSTAAPLQQTNAWCDPGASGALQNGSFETGDISGWGYDGYYAEAADSYTPPDGTYYAYAANNDDGTAPTSLYQNVTVTAGSSNSFTLYATIHDYDEGKGAYLSAQYYDGGGNPIGTAVTEVVTHVLETDGWGLYTLDLGTAPANAASARISANTSDAKFIKIDAVCLYSVILKDFGDLPDSFETTDSAGGPSHVITADLYLGSCVDAESDGQPDAHAGADGAGSGNGDDGNTGSSTTGTCASAGDDEDGVTLTTPLIPGAQACFNVTAHNGTSSSVNIYAWIDWNGDGDFGSGSTVDTNESFTLGTVPANTDWTDHELFTTVPSDATFDGGETHMRFRFTTDDLGGADWGGEANNGEVEDYWQPLACVGNYVWDDDSGSSANVQDGSDSGISGVTMRLVWADGNGTIDTDASDSAAQGDDLIYTTTTDANGKYSFCGLIPATYRVEIPSAPSGKQTVTPNSGGDDVKDSDGTATGGVGSPVNGEDFTISSVTALPTGENGNQDSGTNGGPNNFPDNQVDETRDFGFTSPKVAIGNFVWNDANGNSQWDSGEAGIDGITVTLYQDTNGNGVCEPGTDTQVGDSIDTSGGGYYQFLDLSPSDSADNKTYYCVVVDKNDVTNAGYAYSSAGGAQNPDTTGDHDAANGDDGVPSGNYVISQPFPATVNGQTVTDSGDPAGYDDNSSYMTVDFGFLTEEQYTAMASPTAISLQDINAQHDSMSWAWGLLAIVLIGPAVFAWQRRRSM